MRMGIVVVVALSSTDVTAASSSRPDSAYMRLSIGATGDEQQPAPPDKINEAMRTPLVQKPDEGQAAVKARDASVDLIRTKDGRLHVGRIVDRVQNGYLFRSEEDGTTYVIEYSTVDDVKSTLPASPQTPSPTPTVPPHDQESVANKRSDGSLEEPQSSYVSDSGFRGSGIIFCFSCASRVVLPGFGLHGQWGGRLSRKIALVGAANGDLLLGSGGTILLASLAPGVRVGEKHHFTFSVGPGLSILNPSQGSSVVFGEFVGRVDLIVVIIGRFDFQMQAAVHIDMQGGVAMTGGIGLGWSTF